MCAFGTKAEGLAKDVTQFCTVLCNDEKLMEMSVLEMKDASSRSVQAEQAANTALADARKIITARQLEANGKDASAELSGELIKFQARLSTAQG